MSLGIISPSFSTEEKLGTSSSFQVSHTYLGELMMWGNLPWAKVKGQLTESYCFYRTLSINLKSKTKQTIN